MQAKWIPACAGMTRYGARRTGSFKESEISRVVIAHGDVSGTKDAAKLPPPLFCQEPQLPTATFFCGLFSDKMSGCRLSLALFA
jgi:hypothetical protein